MKRLTFIAAALVCAGTVFAQDAAAPAGAKKIMLKLSSVETAGTRHQKTWAPPSKPSVLSEKPYSEAQIMQATPEEANRMRAKNEAAADAQRLANAAIALENWREADKHMKGVQAQLEGNAYGRQIILALDKFAGAAGEFFDPDCIEFFHRMDMDEGMQEQALKDMSDPGIAAAPYFVKLIFDDPREESQTVALNSVQEVKMTKYMQAVTYEVQDLQGKIVAAKNVKAEKSIRSSNAVTKGGTSGNDLVETLQEALVLVAKDINDRFVAKVSFTLTGPKNDDDFDENAGTILVDGDGHSPGDEFSILKGPHIVEVQMDNYKRSGSPKLTITKSGQQKIVMTSSMCNVTIKVKGPAGDADFNADDATITLAGDEEFSPSNGNPEKVPQGKYTLTVTMDGYETVTKNVSLGSPKQDIPVSMKKTAE